MSWMTKYFDKPMSVTADVAVCAGVGIAASIVYGAVLPLVPIVGVFAPLVVAPLAGVTAGAAYVRARKNLLDPEPAFPVRPAPPPKSR